MLTFGALAIGGAIASVAVACRPNNGGSQQHKGIVEINDILTPSIQAKQNPSKGSDYELSENDKGTLVANSMTDPYKAALYLARSLDNAGYKFSESGLKDRKNSQGKNFASYEEYALDAIAKVKKYVKAVANLPKIKKLRDDNTTLLYAEVAYKDISTKNNDLALKEFFFQQPSLFPVIYGQPTDEVPGFGLRFPKPVNKTTDKFIDVWYGIGAQANYGGGKGAQPSFYGTLHDSYAGTADYLIFNYDSNKIKAGETKAEWEQYAKNKINNSRVFVSDFQHGYAAIWGLIGTVHLTKQIAKFLGVTDAELNAIQLEWKIPTKDEINYIRSSKAPAEKQKLATHFYSLWDHLIALGVQPDISSYNDDKGTTHKEIAGFLEEYVDKSKTQFVDSATLTDPTKAGSLGIYALAANSSHIGRSFAKHFEQKSIIAKVETERGDTGRTRSPWTFELYDKKANTIQKFKDDASTPYVKSFKKLADELKDATDKMAMEAKEEAKKL
ncbi:Vmc-like lipoprotein signal peptide domain-containing protein [Ureaplasma canigenitalium]|uniref:Vmc-like lipoprotein signal peptide domain-containing protein n=1 Tax=Ureaplasma canigenitalium TaxID=42092 RepID=UPI000690983C|nr:hypothetical protein [Ureaplasma canigenitalium]